MEKVSIEQLREFLERISKGQLSKMGFQGIIDRLPVFNAFGSLVGSPDFTIQPSIAEYIDQIYLNAFGLISLSPYYFRSFVCAFCRLLFALDNSFSEIKEVVRNGHIWLARPTITDARILEIGEILLSQGIAGEHVSWFPGIFFRLPANYLFFENLIRDFSIRVDLANDVLSMYCEEYIKPGFILFPRCEIGANRTWKEQKDIPSEISELLKKSGFDLKVRLANVWEMIYLFFIFKEEKVTNLIRGLARDSVNSVLMRVEYGNKLLIRNPYIPRELMEGYNVGVFPIIVLS